MKLSSLLGFLFFLVIFSIAMPQLPIKDYPPQFSWLFIAFPYIILAIALIKLFSS